MTEFREGIAKRGMTYAAGVAVETSVWKPGMRPIPPKACSGKGPRPSAWCTTPESELHPEEWLIIEWPIDESAPTKYHLCNLPPNITLTKLVQTIHMRWRIERDYQELKDEIGIDHFEGRSWRGFHHHATLCIAAYGFLAAECARLPPHDSRTILPIPNPRRPPPTPRGSPRARRLPLLTDIHHHHQA